MFLLCSKKKKVDCRGFASLLIGKKRSESSIPFSHKFATALNGKRTLTSFLFWGESQVSSPLPFSPSISSYPRSISPFPSESIKSQTFLGGVFFGSFSQLSSLLSNITLFNQHISDDKIHTYPKKSLWGEGIGFRHFLAPTLRFGGLCTCKCDSVY